MVGKSYPGVHVTEALHDWRQVIDLSPMKEEIESIAKQREDQKYHYKTSRQWSDEATNLTGLKGEFAFSICTGLPVNTELNSNGDSGIDFEYGDITYDVKATKYSGRNPMLLEMTGKRLVPHVYVLIRIDEWSARIIGWASRKQVRFSSVKNMGHGPRLSISEDEMQSWDQATIPPCVPSSSTSHAVALERAKKQLANKKTRLKLPYKKSAGEHCFHQGPFEPRAAKQGGNHPALYCTQCGRFYGIDKNAVFSV